jgi:PAS domain S-box-containing protein
MPEYDNDGEENRRFQTFESEYRIASKKIRDLKESEEGFRSLIENAVIGVYRTNESGDFLFANRRLAKIFGYETKEEFLESHTNAAQLYVNPEERDSILNRMRTKGFVDGVEIQFKRRDGEIIWISVRARVMKEKSGGVVYEGFILDITEKKATTIALQESEKRFRMLVEQAGDAFFIHDYIGKILDVNLRACETLGYNRNELLEMNIADVDLEIAKEQHKDRYWDSLQSERYVTFEGTHRRKDGSMFPVEVRLGRVDLGDQPLLLSLTCHLPEIPANEKGRRIN